MMVFFSQGKKDKLNRNRRLNWAERDFISNLWDKGYDEYQIQDLVAMLFNYKLSKQQITHTRDKGIEAFDDKELNEQDKKRIHKQNIDLLADVESKYVRERKDEINKVSLLKNEAFLNLKKRIETDKMSDMLLLKSYQTLFDHNRLLANQPTSIHKYEKFTDEDLAKRLEELERAEAGYIGRIKTKENGGEIVLLAASPETNKVLPEQS